MSPIEPRETTAPATAAVSIFAFCGWLTARRQTSAPFGAEYDAGELAVFAERYFDSQVWPDPPNRRWFHNPRPLPQSPCLTLSLFSPSFAFHCIAKRAAP
jgi:hypothetical protein